VRSSINRRAHGLGVAADLAPLIFAACGQQLCVELIEVPRLRERHPVIASEVAGLTLNPALLVRLRRGAKVTLEPQ